MFLVKDETMTNVLKFLGNLAKPLTEIKKGSILKEDAKSLQTELLASELVQERSPEMPEMPTEPEVGPTHCMWKDCTEPGGRHTLAGVRLCTFHYSQAVSSGRVEVTI